MSNKKMSVSEHIVELRRRIIIIIAGLAMTFIAGLFLAPPIIIYLQGAEEAQNISMNAFRVTDPFEIYLKFAFLIGIIFAAPLALFQLWGFVSPGLYEHERRVTLMYIPVAFLLFLLGLAFSYYILFPYVINFMGGIGDLLNIEEEIGVNEYFAFLLQLTLPFGVLFQLPILVMFLTRLGLVTPMLLGQIRKQAYFVLLVIAGLVTPPELMSHLMVTGPMLLLYEVSIMISRFAYRQAKKSEIREMNNPND